MFRGIYSAAAAMIVGQKRQEVIAENLANMNTNGYRADQYRSNGFSAVLQERVEGLEPVARRPILGMGEVGTLGTGVDPDLFRISFDQGGLRETGTETDLAINGDAFFTVQTPNGLAYTRDGSFRVDAEGTLLNGQGYQVLGQNGPIVVGQGSFEVRPDGTIVQNDQVVGQLRLVSFGDSANARKIGANLLVAAAGAPEPGPATGSEVLQGSIEQSNVDSTRTMTDMMSVLRSYESSQKAIQLEDQSFERAVTEVGSLRG